MMVIPHLSDVSGEAIISMIRNSHQANIIQHGNMSVYEVLIIHRVPFVFLVDC